MCPSIRDTPSALRPAQNGHTLTIYGQSLDSIEAGTLNVNGTPYIVNGTGTLQMVDILGRIVFTSQVNPSLLTPHSSLTPGVYVLRLINGNEIKSQKIVIQ